MEKKLFFGVILLFFFFSVCCSLSFAASPDGSIFRVDCSGFSGWVVDPDRPNDFTHIALVSDKQADGTGGMTWGWFKADQPWGTPYPGNHGFSYVLPDGLKNGRSHSLWLYGIDLTGDTHRLFGQYPVNCAGAPPVIPKSPPPSQNIYYIDYHYLTGSYIERVNQAQSSAEYIQSSALSFFTVALQGLVNRSSPRIYTNDEEEVWRQGSDYWKSIVEAKNGAPMIQINNNDPYTLANIFKNDPGISGIAIYDKNIWIDNNRGDLINLLTGFCAIKNCLPVTAEIRTNLQNQGIDLPVIANFTNGAPLVNYSFDHEGIYRYMVEVLWANANHSVVANLHPLLFVQSRDYFFAHKILPFFIRQDATSIEEREIKKIFSKGLPLGGHILGQVGSHNNDWLQPIFSPYMQPILGKYEEGITALDGIWELTSKEGLTIDYTHTMNNMSVHSGFPSTPLVRKKHTPPALNSNKIYLTFNLSEGDNISWDNHLWARTWLEFPHTLKLNWAFNPLLYELAPDILSWYYENATNNDYLMPWGGTGSIQTVVFGENTSEGHVGALNKYINNTCQYLINLDQKMIYSSFSAAAQEDLNQFAASGCFKAVFSDYNISLGYYNLPSAVYENATRIVNSTGIFRPIVALFIVNGQTVDSFVNELAQKIPTTRPAFLNIWVLGNRALYWRDDTNYIQAVINRLNPNIYEVVTADDFVALFRQANGFPDPTPTPDPHCLPLGDIDCSGQINSLDQSLLLTALHANNPRADLDNSGIVNFFDLSFLTKAIR